MPTTISHSEVDSFLSCERKWFYGYVMGIERIKTSEAMLRGTYGHGALEVIYNARQAGATWQEQVKAGKDYLLELLTNGGEPKLISEVVDLITFHMQVDPFKGWKVLSVEGEFVAPLTDEIDYPLVLDLLLQKPNGTIAMVDHKFVYNFYRPEEVDLLPQMPKYIAAMKKLDFKVDVAIYNMLRYRNMKENTADNKVGTYEFEVSDTRLRTTAQEQLDAAERVHARRQQSVETLSARSLRVGNKMVCGGCSFKSICAAELLNNNPQLVLRSEYKKRVRRTFSEDEE